MGVGVNLISGFICGFVSLGFVSPVNVVVGFGFGVEFI